MNEVVALGLREVTGSMPVFSTKCCSKDSSLSRTTARLPTQEPFPVSSHATSLALLQLTLYYKQSASLPAADSARAGRSLYT